MLRPPQPGECTEGDRADFIAAPMSDPTEAPPETPEAAARGFRRFELLCGVTLTIFAAIIALNDLSAGRYNSEALIANNEKASGYTWYQSKSVKESLTKTQRDMLRALLRSGAIDPERRQAIEEEATDLDAEASRYDREQREILLGSRVVGRENWAQEFNGEMGKVIGANEWGAKYLELSDAGNTFDLATLLLQLGIVLGAMSLAISLPVVRKTLYSGLVLFGVAGTIVSIVAFQVASRA
jgi:hypothetical protein